MKDWSIRTFEDVQRGDIVEWKKADKVFSGEVATVSVVRTVGPELGRIELYVRGAGPIRATATEPIEVYR